MLGTLASAPQLPAFFFKFFVLMWTIFKVFIKLLQYCFYFMFWFFGPEARGTLAPRPGIKPAAPALEGGVSTTGPPGKSLSSHLYKLNGSSSDLPATVHIKQVDTGKVFSLTVVKYT